MKRKRFTKRAHQKVSWEYTYEHQRFNDAYLTRSAKLTKRKREQNQRERETHRQTKRMNTGAGVPITSSFVNWFRISSVADRLAVLLGRGNRADDPEVFRLFLSLARYLRKCEHFAVCVSVCASLRCNIFCLETRFSLSPVGLGESGVENWICDCVVSLLGLVWLHTKCGSQWIRIILPCSFCWWCLFEWSLWLIRNVKWLFWLCVWGLGEFSNQPEC